MRTFRSTSHFVRLAPLMPVGLALSLASCSSDSSDGNHTGYGTGGGYVASGGGPGAGGSVPGGGGIPVTSTGGNTNPATGGNMPSAGGSVNPSTGGSTNPGSGGSVSPGSGGSPTTGGVGPSTGGSAPGSGGVPASGGAGPAGGSGGGGPVSLPTCDGTKETAANPIITPCGTFITPLGKTLQLGPYGSQMSVNEGKGFENPNPNDDGTCPAFVGIFNEGAALSKQLLDTGPQPCKATAPNTGACLDYTLYTVYRPANWPAGPVPVLSWGNGTCAQPEGYGALLRYIASYGYVVIAANSRQIGSGAAQKKAIDFAAAANKDSSSPYFGHLDLTKVGVMGHSQGGAATVIAAGDSRVSAAILYNGGTSAAKPFLAISGDLDIAAIAGGSASALQTAVNAAPKGAYLWYHNPAGNTSDGFRGHLVLMLTPERVAPASVAFWDLILKGDQKARDMFVGASCGLCGHSSDFEFGQHGL